ncbi:MAG: hypothetical protein IKN54_02890 [Lachnospiraceae bacterium]|nr:hypothetical protein [Lachnospiraceae bacterium]
MKLLYLILKKTEYISELNEELKNIGIHHGTIIDGRSMTNGLRPWSDDSIIIGGVLRRNKNFEYNEDCKVLMFVLSDEQVTKTREVINNVIGDISKPGTAVMFTVPIDMAEGLGE